MSLGPVISIISLVFGVWFCASAQGEEPIYTRSSSLPPLRITYSELQTVLDKSSSLMTAANAPYSTQPITERLALKHGDFGVELRDHKLQGSKAKLPKLATELFYTASTSSLEKVPVATVSLLFYDHDRGIKVEGRSPEQVDALFASLKSDFLGLSSSFGGLNFRLLTGAVSFLACILVVLFGLIYSLSTSQTKLILPIVIAFISLALLMYLPFNIFLAGFSVSEFDPSFGSPLKSPSGKTASIPAAGLEPEKRTAVRSVFRCLFGVYPTT